MNYRDFDLSRVQQDFGITIATSQSLFRHVAPIALSPTLKGYLDSIFPLGATMRTEKGRSELLVAPLLSEVWLRSDKRIAVLSGFDFDVDPAAGLTGTADFLLCRSENLYDVSTPVLVAVEAKRDSIPDGLGQCAAEMIAAQRLNARTNQQVDTVYGCVTTGVSWKFLRLRTNRLDIDADEYMIAAPDRILGLLLSCCGVSIPGRSRGVNPEVGAISIFPQSPLRPATIEATLLRCRERMRCSRRQKRTRLNDGPSILSEVRITSVLEESGEVE